MTELDGYSCNRCDSEISRKDVMDGKEVWHRMVYSELGKITYRDMKEHAKRVDLCHECWGHLWEMMCEGLSPYSWDDI
jgi:hypothetical protein